MDPGTFAQLNANAEHNYAINQQSQTAKAAPKSKGPSGIKGLIVNALPSILGGAGLVGGEILDPFGGGLLSGAAASGAGEALKEKLSGQSISPKQIAIQGAETAALGTAGKAFSSARGGSKALLATKEATPAASATDTLIQNAETDAKPTVGQKLTSTLVNKGEQTQAKLGGFAPGQKIAGTQLNTAASNRIGQTLADEGVNALSAPDQLGQVGNKLSSLNKARSALIDANNTPLTDDDKKALLQTVQNNLSKTAGGTADTVQKHANTFLGEALNNDDVASLGKYKTSLDNNAINYNRNPAAAEPGQALAAKTVRGAIKDMIEQKVPGIADINARSTNLSTAEGALMNSSARLANLTTGGEGLWGRILSGETAEKGKALAAKGAVKVGSALGGKGGIEAIPAATDIAETTAKTAPQAITAETPIPRTTSALLKTITNKPSNIVKGIAGRTGAPILAAPGKTVGAILGQAGGRAIGDLSSALQPQPVNSQLGNASDSATGDVTQLGTSSLNSGNASDTTSSSENSTYPEANMLYDIERDPKNASTYEALYKIINPTPPSNSLDNLTTNQKNQLSGSQNAIAALQGYLDQVQGLSSGSQGPVGGRLSAFLGKYGVGGQQSANAYALESSAADVATQIAAGLSPTGRGTTSLIAQVKESLPKVSDSPQAAQAKVSQLINRLQSVMQTEATPLSTYVGSSAGGGDIGSQLQDLLATSGGIQ